MTHSANAIALIKLFEGCRLTSYQDGNGIWTIGYGHTGPSVKAWLIWTQEQADSWLNIDLAATDSAIGRLVKVPLTQNQYDALMSLVYNIGAGHFGASTCLRELNAGNYAAACSAIGMWNKVAGAVSQGLERRRAAEMALFAKETA